MEKERIEFCLAIAGGSGVGKTFLAKQLLRRLGEDRCVILPMDRFYRDLRALPVAEREAMNFDHPKALDWDQFRFCFMELLEGRGVYVPIYDFCTHTRREIQEYVEAKPILIVEGLWALWPRWIRRALRMGIYTECPLEERFRRRVDRDLTERGRTVMEVFHRFYGQVVPMERRFVEPQRKWAHVILHSPWIEDQIQEITREIHT